LWSVPDDFLTVTEKNNCGGWDVYSKPIALKFIRFTVFLVLVYFALLAAGALGVEEKSWFERSWDLLAGGSLGAMAGLLFFLLFGAIGWVSGAIYGSLGLLSLLIGGGLGGLGLGTIVNMVRHPDDYNVNLPVFFSILFVGVAFAYFLSKLAEGWASKKLPDRESE
jgi:hypothetical protein